MEWLARDLQQRYLDEAAHDRLLREARAPRPSTRQRLAAALRALAWRLERAPEPRLAAAR